jgi:hypothetical protein
MHSKLKKVIDFSQCQARMSSAGRDGSLILAIGINIDLIKNFDNQELLQALTRCAGRRGWLPSPVIRAPRSSIDWGERRGGLGDLREGLTDVIDEEGRRGVGGRRWSSCRWRR